MVWTLILTECYIVTEVDKFMSLVTSYVASISVHIVRHNTSRYCFTIQHSVMSYLTGPGLPYTSILFHKLQYYPDRVSAHKNVCFVCLYNIVRNISSLRRIRRVKYMEVFMLSKCYFCYILRKTEFS